MMEKLLSAEGPVVGFLNKTGELIVLSVLWILGCLPLATIGASNAALYFAVAKSIRCGQGSAVKEFLSSYRSNLCRGSGITVVSGLLVGLLLWNLGFLQEQPSAFLAGGTVILLILLLLAWVYMGPVLSRFSISALEVWKLTFVMALRHLPVTLLLLAGTLLLAALQIFVLPMAAVLILPGLWSYLTTFLVEPALRRYMPEKDEEDNAWYFDM